jgi:hypothetical protein
MIEDILIYAGAFIVSAWGIAHLFPTEAVVKSFGSISDDSKQLIRMEWLAEGFALIFLGIVTFLANIAGAHDNPASIAVTYAAAAFSLAVAVLALFTGARTKVVPVKVCPAVMTLAAVLFLMGNSL